MVYILKIHTYIIDKNYRYLLGRSKIIKLAYAECRHIFTVSRAPIYLFLRQYCDKIDLFDSDISKFSIKTNYKIKIRPSFVDENLLYK